MKLILFDIGNVFINPAHDIFFDLLLKRYKIKSNVHNYIIDGLFKIINNSFFGIDNFEMTISKIAKFLNTSEKEILSILNESIKNNNANLELKIIIKKLARNNKVGIFSDLSYIGLKVFKYYFSDVEYLFDVNLMYFSFNEEKTKKMNGKSYFKHIFGKTGYAFNDIYFIDDEKENYNNSLELGVNGMRYTKNKKYKYWKTSNRILMNQLSNLNLLCKFH